MEINGNINSFKFLFFAATLVLALVGCDSEGNLIATTDTRLPPAVASDNVSGTSELRIEDGVEDRSGSVHNAVVLVNGGCTGTLVAPDLILTAAHCMVDDALPYYTGGWSTLPVPVSIQFGPRRTSLLPYSATADQISAPPPRTGGPGWQEDIVLLRLTSDVPATTAVPRPVYLDYPAPLLPYSSLSQVIYQIGYGGSRNRRVMTGTDYNDWMSSSWDLQINAFDYVADSLGIGERGTNIESGDSGGPMTLNSVSGPVMGVLSHWRPTGIATYGPGGDGRPSVRNWLRAHLPRQYSDFEIVSIAPGGCTGSGGDPVITVTIKNRGAVQGQIWVSLFAGLPYAPRMGEYSTMNRWSKLLAPEETQSMSFAVTDGFNRGWADAIVDSPNYMPELNERNNIHSTFIQSLPDCSFN